MDYRIDVVRSTKFHKRAVFRRHCLAARRRKLHHVLNTERYRERIELHDRLVLLRQYKLLQQDADNPAARQQRWLRGRRLLEQYL